MFTFSFLISSLLVLAGCNDAATDNPPPAVTPVTAAPPAAPGLPAMMMLDANGGLVDLQQYRGKKVLVNLWASWCPPCKREMPSLQKLYNDVDTSKVVFVMLALDDDFNKSKKYVASKEFTFPVFYPAQNLPPLFNVESIPTTFIFNEKGEMIKSVVGSDDYDSKEYRRLFL